MLQLVTAGASRRVVSALLLTIYLFGCTSWRLQQGAPADVLARKKPGTVRVVLAGGRQELLRAPRIENDSLVGETRSGSSARRAIPVDSVAAISVQSTDGAKTALLLVGVGVTLVVVLAAIAAADDPMFTPSPGGSGQPVVSCPLVYSWDGTGWKLDSGTFGGAIMPILARTDVDNLDFATAQDGVLRLRLANELNETDYVDAISVIAVDHDPSVSVAPSADGTIHTLGRLETPLAATDDRGIGILDRLTARDGWSWESRPAVRDTAKDADIRDGVNLVFAKPAGAKEALLVVDGSNTPWAAYMVQEFVRAHGRNTQAWYDSVNASPALAQRLGAMMAREGFLDVQLKVNDEWIHQDYVWEAGPEISKQQVLRLDVSGVTGDSVEIRLESAPMFWLIDRVALDYSTQRSITTHELNAQVAIGHYGDDVRARLSTVDRAYHVLNTGDRTELTFASPPVPAGMKRSYLLRSHGWYHITAPEVEEPDLALLNTVTSERHGASRAAVARFNAALGLLNRGAQ